MQLQQCNEYNFFCRQQQSKKQHTSASDEHEPLGRPAGQQSGRLSGFDFSSDNGPRINFINQYLIKVKFKRLTDPSFSGLRSDGARVRVSIDFEPGLVPALTRRKKICFVGHLSMMTYWLHLHLQAAGGPVVGDHAGVFEIYDHEALQRPVPGAGRRLFTGWPLDPVWQGAAVRRVGPGLHRRGGGRRGGEVSILAANLRSF